MKCQDVRRAFPLLVTGEIPLTEWAILETHLVGCAECRKELERLRTQALERKRTQRRNATTAIGVASAVLVAVILFYLYEASIREWSRPESPRAALPASEPAPPVAAPAPPALPARAHVAPPAPAAVAAPRPVPAVAPRAKTAVGPTTPRAPAPAVVETTPPPASAPRSVAVPAGERMPTQARPAAVVHAAPGAEAMPTQAAPRRRE